MLLNLLENAARHTPPGTALRLWAAPHRGGVEFGLEDQGPGLPEGQEDRIFERFHSPGGGSGLGLAIARGVMKAHGGWIQASNRPGGGACFRCWLPQELDT